MDDDTRILLGIKNEEDTQIQQNYLHKLYKWANTNNMKFNANKFELLRYGKVQEIKSATTYKPYDDSNIDDKEQVRDLGIMMSNTPTFTLHIRNIVKKARDTMGWVLRVFQSGALSHADTFKISPLLEYCCQLWNPWKTIDIQAIEAIQRTFPYKITEVQHLNNWERLHKLKLYSLQRRGELYIIIYIWKVTQHMVLYIDGTMGHKINTRKHPRPGTQCVIRYPTNRNPAQSLQEDAITVFGPRLYNPLPKDLRDIESVKTRKIKFELDKFLELIPNQSKMSNYVSASGSNSILDQLTHLRAHGIY